MYLHIAHNIRVGIPVIRVYTPYLYIYVFHPGGRRRWSALLRLSRTPFLRIGERGNARAV